MTDYFWGMDDEFRRLNLKRKQLIDECAKLLPGKSREAVTSTALRAYNGTQVEDHMAAIVEDALKTLGVLPPPPPHRRPYVRLARQGIL